MARFGVGVMHTTINSRFGPKPLVHADYAIGLACGADSFWVADYLNSAATAGSGIERELRAFASATGIAG
jgi:hypothetical protein